MRRWVSAAGALAAASMLLAGCAAPGTGATAPSTDSASASAADVADSTLTVFAAASLATVFDELAERFEAEHAGVDVVVNSGGSGALAEQIVQGAPADVFAAAAEAPMQRVVDAGLAETPIVFATNTLELVVPAGNPAGVTGLDDLEREELRIALCDGSVPCGAAGARLFTAAGVTPAPDTLESDVTAVLTKVALGEADAGVVYRTDVLASPDAVEHIEVPGAASVVTRYPIASMTDASAPTIASAFVDLVAGDLGRAVLGDAGFGAP